MSAAVSASLRNEKASRIAVIFSSTNSGASCMPPA
jgi:hypothetical protein